MSIAHINQALSAYGAAQRRLRLDAEPAAARIRQIELEPERGGEALRIHRAGLAADCGD